MHATTRTRLPADGRTMGCSCLEDSTATFGWSLSSHERMIRTASAVVACLLILVPSASTQGGADVTGMLETYYQGRHDEAVTRASALTDLGGFRLRFVQDSPVWVNADPARIDARRAAAAAFLLEVAAARLESD